MIHARRTPLEKGKKYFLRSFLRDSDANEEGEGGERNSCGHVLTCPFARLSARTAPPRGSVPRVLWPGFLQQQLLCWVQPVSHVGKSLALMCVCVCVRGNPQCRVLNQGRGKRKKTHTYIQQPNLIPASSQQQERRGGEH